MAHNGSYQDCAKPPLKDMHVRVAAFRYRHSAFGGVVFVHIVGNCIFETDSYVVKMKVVKSANKVVVHSPNYGNGNKSSSFECSFPSSDIIALQKTKHKQPASI